MDTFVLMDTIEFYDDVAVADDYTASFTITAQGYTANGTVVPGATASASMFLHGYYLTDTEAEAAEAAHTSYFDIEPTNLATYYRLDDIDNKTAYNTIATVHFFAATDIKQGSSIEVTSLNNLKYAIVLSSEPTAESNATPFHFTYTKDLSKTINYYARMVGTTDTSQFTNLATSNIAYFTNTSSDLTGTEAINLGSLRSTSSLDATRRYILVPQLNKGQKDKKPNRYGTYNITYYFRYMYEGEIQIKLPADLLPSEHPAGLYTSNIYVTLISL